MYRFILTDIPTRVSQSELQISLRSQLGEVSASFNYDPLTRMSNGVALMTVATQQARKCLLSHPLRISGAEISIVEVETFQQ